MGLFDDWDKYTIGPGTPGGGYPGGGIPSPGPPPPSMPGTPGPEGGPLAPWAIPQGGSDSGGGAPGVNFQGFDFEQVPGFTPDMFKAPSFDEATNDPSYRLRIDAGREGIERSAAAKGMLRTGGTLKDIASFNQNFAAQEYANIFDRALRGYGARYQAQKDMFAPQFAGWQLRALAEKQAKLAQLQNAHDSAQQAANRSSSSAAAAAASVLGSPPQAPSKV